MPSKVTKPNTSAQPKLMSIGLDIGKEGRMCAITLRHEPHRELQCFLWWVGYGDFGLC
jgi:hypothetical protein